LETPKDYDPALPPIVVFCPRHASDSQKRWVDINLYGKKMILIRRLRSWLSHCIRQRGMPVMLKWRVDQWDNGDPDGKGEPAERFQRISW